MPDVVGPQQNIPVTSAPDETGTAGFPFSYWGTISTLLGLAMYVVGVAFSWVRAIGQLGPDARAFNEAILWYSGVPTTVGVVAIAIDLAVLLPRKRRVPRRLDPGGPPVSAVTVALTAYNDEDSIAAAVVDFIGHPLVKRVIVVSNGSTDATFARAAAAGAIVKDETRQGYGWCVYRCLSEAAAFDDTSHVVLCEGDRTFRARDIDKLVAYAPHADLVNGTRIVEQLREFQTQLGTFMYYGNFFVGKLLEVKHLGRGTFTDVGTTYKAITRDALARLLPALDPRINLEFNAHLLDTALTLGISVVECPITFHPRVGTSKGGNVNNRRAMAVGLRMILGLSFGWKRLVR